MNVVERVVLVDYDPAWPGRFREENERIRGAIGRFLVHLEHIGSTAVPGLVAKPVLDLMAGTRGLADFAECLGALQALGYEYVPEYEALIADRRFLHRGPVGRRTHQLHVVEYGSDFWSRHLLFRDYLRTHPEEALRYVALKRRLASLIGYDPHLYADAKSDFIRRAVAKARKGIG